MQHLTQIVDINSVLFLKFTCIWFYSLKLFRIFVAINRGLDEANHAEMAEFNSQEALSTSNFHLYLCFAPILRDNTFRIIPRLVHL